MKKAAIIIENRNIKGLDKIIDNHMKFLPEWDLIHFRSYHIKNRVDYNLVLTSFIFWDRLCGYDKVLIFQHDSEILRTGINEFVNYGYVGAPWRKEFSWNTSDRRGGNGGLSIRDVEDHLDLIYREKFDPSFINEDIWFSHKLANVAPYEICKKFSVETDYQLGTFGAHAIDKHLTEQECKLIRDQYK